MIFQTLGGEDKDLNDRIIQNMCSIFGSDIQQLVNFPVNAEKI